MQRKLKNFCFSGCALKLAVPHVLRLWCSYLQPLEKSPSGPAQVGQGRHAPRGAHWFGLDGVDGCKRGIGRKKSRFFSASTWVMQAEKLTNLGLPYPKKNLANRQEFACPNTLSLRKLP